MIINLLEPVNELQSKFPKLLFLQKASAFQIQSLKRFLENTL
jgi:hypothetical protein